MKKLLLIVLLLTGVAASKTLACSCQHNYAFCYTLNQLPNDLAVTGVITAMQDTTYLRMRILETFKGIETNDTITVWAGTGGGCSPGWESLATHHMGSVNDTIVVILQRITVNNLENTWDVAGDYRRLKSLCYHPLLKVSNGQVTGRIMGSYMFGPTPWSVNSMTYTDFQAAWTGESLFCPITLTAEENALTKFSFSLFPNPAADQTTIAWDLPQIAGTTEITVLDINSREVKRQPISGIKGEYVLDTRHLPASLYLYRFTQAGQQLGSGKFSVVK